MESTEDAGICPNCGAAYVTEKAIKNLNAAATAQQPKSRTYQELANLAEKYNAFVALYKIDNYSLMEVYRFREKIRDKEALVNKYVDDYNSSISAEEKMRNKYNRRVDGFNDAKYTAGTDSLQEKLHRKYVESALNKRTFIESDIKYSKKKAEEEHNELQRLVEEEKVFSLKIFKENLQYNYLAKAVAEKMCNDYPSNPLGYLYLSDWYNREAKWQKKFYEFARERYEEDSVVVTEFTKEFNYENANKSTKLELEKAQTFMSDEFNLEYGDLVEKLKGAKKAKKSTTQPSNTAKASSSTATKSNTSKTPSSTTTRATTAKSGTSAKSKPKSNAKTKPTASTMPKFKSGSEKKNKKKLERKLKAKHFVFKVVFNLLFWGILAAAAACVCKFVFHLF
ncbi:MAG: hypothetical protein K2M75_05005 [Clostridia bacterium]|nr:hypothetical protein [Clostridia bacterium]